MRGIEYFKEFKDDLEILTIDPENNKSISSKILKAFDNELKEIIDQRKCKIDSSCFSVVLELNKRFNIMVDEFEKYFQKPCALRKNAFRLVWKDRLGIATQDDIADIPGVSIINGRIISTKETETK